MTISILVRDLVRRKLISIDQDDAVYDAVVMMSTSNIGAIVATSFGKPVGIITERDLMKKVTLRGLNPKEVKVREVMSSPLVTVGPDSSIGEAAMLMQTKGIRRLLVKDGDEVTGIVTQRDLERGVLDYFAALSTLT